MRARRDDAHATFIPFGPARLPARPPLAVPRLSNRDDLAPLLPCNWTTTTSLTTIP
jgi:hypothetical protein